MYKHKDSLFPTYLFFLIPHLDLGFHARVNLSLVNCQNPFEIFQRAET